MRQLSEIGLDGEIYDDGEVYYLFPVDLEIENDPLE
jgi:hypothetical protein